jgi:hypothetical protein
MSEDLRYNLGIVATVLGVIAVWGIFYAVFGLAGAIVLTATIGVVVGALSGAAWYFEEKRTALPAKLISSGAKCTNCTHEFNVHYLINYSGELFDGGEMICTGYDCPCKSKWSAEITQVPDPEREDSSW